VKVITLSAERPHEEFLPAGRKKSAVLASVIAVLGALSLFALPQQAVSNQYGVLAILTAGLIAFLVLFAPRGPVESAEVVSRDSQIHVKLSLDKERSGYVEVGELTMFGFSREESYHTLFNLEPKSSQHFSNQRRIEFMLPLSEAGGLVYRRGVALNGLIKCPGCKIILQDGQELYAAALVSIGRARKTHPAKTTLLAGGAQCILREGAEGGLSFLISAAEVAGGMGSAKVSLKILRRLRERDIELSFEEKIMELGSGGGSSGVWRPGSLGGKGIVIIFNGTLSFLNVVEALGLNELLLDPAPGVEYSVVLETSLTRLISWRDEAPLTISLNGAEKD
jgi:hypothetical protein